MAARSRLLHLVDSNQVGGTEEVVLTLLSDLQGLGWAPTLCCTDDAGLQSFRDGAASRGIECVLLPSSSGRSGLAIGRSFFRVVRRLRPALVHVHLNWPLASRHQVMAARIAGVRRVIATSHLVTEIDGFRSRGLHALQVRLIDRYLAVSSAVKDRLCGELHVPARKVSVVWNGVRLDTGPIKDPTTLRHELVGADDHRQIAFTPARLHAQKGHQFLIEAAAQVPDVVFVLAGTGPAEPGLRQLATELGVADRVHFLGFRPDIADLLHACDLFVLPSLYEGLPITVLEAMRAARPIVATAVDGTKEAIEAGKSGLLVPPADVAALAAAIRTVVTDRPLAARLARNARRRVEQEFSGRLMAQRVGKAYEELLGLPPGA